jgi:hypothetical protein
MRRCKQRQAMAVMEQQLTGRPGNLELIRFLIPKAGHTPSQLQGQTVRTAPQLLAKLENQFPFLLSALSALAALPVCQGCRGLVAVDQVAAG